MDNINNVFSLTNKSIQIMGQNFQIYQIVTHKYAQLSNSIEIPIKQLEKILQNLKKHSDISISLLKSSEQLIQSPSRVSEYHLTQYQQIIKKLPVQNILLKILQTIQSTLSQIIQYSEQKHKNKKKKNIKIQDSMFITVYQQELNQQQQSQQQNEIKKYSWLYKDIRKNIPIQNYELQKLKSKIQILKPSFQQKQIENSTNQFEAKFLSKNDKNGKISILKKYIKFQSDDKVSLILIPFEIIQQIITKTSFFNIKLLIIETNKGKVAFQNIINYQKCIELISQKIQQLKQMTPIIQQQKRKKILLQPSQLQIILLRKQKLLSKYKITGNTDMYIKLPSVNLLNTDIQDVYSEIFSDQSKIINGKSYPSYFAYSYSTLNNSKIIINKLQPKGPKFYTLYQQFDFTNCSDFSERINQYDHKLPNLPIPLMPKFCHVKQIHKIYWMSHEEFILYTQSHTSGAPYTTSFFTKTTFTVTQKGKDVQILLLSGIQFVQQPLVKSMLKQKSEQQIRQGGTKTLELMKNRIQYLKNRELNNEKAQIIIKQQKLIQSKQQNIQSNNIRKQIQQLKKMKQKMILVAIILVLFSLGVRFL